MDRPNEVADVAAWHARLGRGAFTRSAPVGDRASIVQFRDTDARIEQPALDRTLLVLHLGGPKRIVRTQGSRQREVDVADRSVTLIPAREGFAWETFGPIAFAHLVIDEAELARTIAENDVDPARIRLDPFVGSEDPDLFRPLEALLRGLDDPAADELRGEELVATLAWNVVRCAAAPAERCDRWRLGRSKLATWQLRRVIDHMHAQLGQEIALDTLVALSGVGRARFFRGFKASTGQAPFEYLRSLRLLEARRLLADTDRPITEIAASVGLEPTRLAAAFRDRYQTTPRVFRAGFRKPE